MSVQTIAAADALTRLAEFSAIIDARSESEFAHDHLPGAVNWPSLNDAQRARVGTLYKQASPFEARKLGATLVARNIADHIERELGDTPRGWRPLLYCWRGGQRSGALALVLGQIGFRVQLIEGGYKAFRAAMLADLPARIEPLSFRVICGPTGSGKTRLLHALAAAGAQVLDLEGLARHRASVLGAIPGVPQPSQKHFETCLWDALRGLAPPRRVWGGGKTTRGASLPVPEPLSAAVRASAWLGVDLSEDERVALLLEDYPFFVSDPAYFGQRLDTLVALRGRAVVDGWKAQIAAGRTEAVVRELLEKHYDPGYASSTRRNFARFEQARVVRLADRSAVAMAAASAEILAAG